MKLKILKKHWDRAMKMKEAADWSAQHCLLAQAFKEQYPNEELNYCGFSVISTTNRSYQIEDTQKEKVKQVVQHACYQREEGRKMLPLTVELLPSR